MTSDYDAANINGNLTVAPEPPGDDDATPSFLAVLSALVLLLLCLGLLAANLGIVHYERVVPDTHRTLLNK